MLAPPFVNSIGAYWLFYSVRFVLQELFDTC